MQRGCGAGGDVVEAGSGGEDGNEAADVGVVVTRQVPARVLRHSGSSRVSSDSTTTSASWSRSPSARTTPQNFAMVLDNGCELPSYHGFSASGGGARNNVTSFCLRVSANFAATVCALAKGRSRDWFLGNTNVQLDASAARTLSTSSRLLAAG